VKDSRTQKSYSQLDVDVLYPSSRYTMLQTFNVAESAITHIFLHLRIDISDRKISTLF
jgi:hypothetical protein